MHLTLRTLIAWLDDTLSPSQVREIGQKVDESSVARDLIDRIRRVTRQRRLTVPNANGPDGTDPQIVASYLDNQLPPDQVAEFEKRCLTSDVHLAEVASVHQILSMIGQRAKVPAEARHRMYHLIKGREAVRSTVPRAFQPPAPDLVSEPIAPWVAPEIPRVPWYRKWRSVATVAGLLALLLVAVWMTTPPSRPRTTPRPIVRSAAHAGAGAVPAAPPISAPALPARDRQPPAPAATEPGRSGSAATAGRSDRETDTAETESTTPRPEGPLLPGSVGSVEETEGVLLRSHSAQDKSGTPATWERLTPPTDLRADTRLVSLAPGHQVLQLGKTRVELLDETDLRLVTPGRREDGRIELRYGRLLITRPPQANAIGIGLEGFRGTLRIQANTEDPVGVERIELPPTATRKSWSAALRVYASGGDVDLSAGEAVERLTGPGWIDFEAPDRFNGKRTSSVPDWVTKPGLPPVRKQIASLFSRAIKPELVKPSLMECLDPQGQKEIKRAALAALGTIGEIDIVVGALRAREDPASRLAAMNTLRNLLARGPSSANAVHQELIQEGGEDWAKRVEKLLQGYTPEEARAKETYDDLVKDLSNPDGTIRALALDDLMSLTHRDNLDYDPDRYQEGRGLENWKTLSDKDQLRPRSSARPRGSQ